MNVTDTTTLEPRQTAAQRGMTVWEWLKNLFKVTEFVMFLVVILLLVGGWLKNPNLLDEGNLKIMTRDIAILGIAAIGVGFTIITAGIDLSVGSMVGFGGRHGRLFHEGIRVADRDEHRCDPGFRGLRRPDTWAVCHQAQNARLPDHPGHNGSGARVYPRHH